MRWAQVAGFSERNAHIISQANYFTDHADSGMHPWGINGSDQSFHFNRNASGVDSRIQHAETRLASAIDKGLQAQSLMEQASRHMLSDGRMTDQGRRLVAEALALRDAALVDLGHGLHALQDIHAHGQINANNGDWGWGHFPQLFAPDDPHRAWTSQGQTWVSLPQGSNQQRFHDTKTDTINYLNRFREGVGW
jgi:hypothetical protein